LLSGLLLPLLPLPPLFSLLGFLFFPLSLFSLFVLLLQLSHHFVLFFTLDFLLLLDHFRLLLELLAAFALFGLGFFLFDDDHLLSLFFFETFLELSCFLVIVGTAIRWEVTALSLRLWRFLFNLSFLRSHDFRSYLISLIIKVFIRWPMRRSRGATCLWVDNLLLLWLLSWTFDIVLGIWHDHHTFVIADLLFLFGRLAWPLLDWLEACLHTFDFGNSSNFFGFVALGIGLLFICLTCRADSIDRL